MSAYAPPFLFALFVWWFSTGLILCLLRLPRRLHGWVALGATVLLVPTLQGLYLTAQDPSVFGAYAAFLCGLAIWAWHETLFLLGYVTGPERRPRPVESVGWDRFVRASMTVLYHEAAILLTAVLVVWIAADAPNQTGVWTFLALWLLRLSAKLNIYFGVPNMNVEFLPPHLGYLASHFKTAPMNAFFPASITAATAAALLVAEAARGAEPAAAAGLSVLATLIALAVVEHWFLVLPLPDAALWRWALPRRDAPPPPLPPEPAWRWQP